MSDIVARMRCRTLMWNCGNGDVRDVPDEDCLEAADEIERLRAENERLLAELDEQARLNGAGAERELSLLAEIEQLRRELDEARAFLAEQEKK